MIQNFVPTVNPQETAQLISSGGMIIGGFGVWAGGAAIIGVGVFEIGTITAGNPAGWFGPHLMADGSLMVGAGSFMMYQGWEMFMEYWYEYYEPPSNQNPCP